MGFFGIVHVLFCAAFATADLDWLKTSSDCDETDSTQSACENKWSTKGCKWVGDSSTGKCVLDSCSKFSGLNDDGAGCLSASWCVYIGGTSDKCIFDDCIHKGPCSSGESISWALRGGSDGPQSANLGTCVTYYFTNKTECNGTTTIDDQFCQFSSNNAGDGSGVKNVGMDWCFYTQINNSCSTGLCTPLEVLSSGKYTCQSNGQDDCSEFAGSSTQDSDWRGWCECIGSSSKANCELSPYCYWTKDTCAYDKCTLQFNNASECDTFGCTARNVRKDNVLYSICINSTRDSETSKPNECFFALSVKENCGVDTNVCTDTGLVETSGKGAAASGNCTLYEISGGFFPVKYYCGDGRPVPVDSNAGILVRVPALLTVLLAALIVVL